MRPIRKILVAVKDPGARTLPAVAKATQLAQGCGASLELFHAIDRCIYVDMLGLNESNVRPLYGEERAQYRQRLERIAARVRLHGVEVAVAAAWDFPAYEAIVRRATQIGADLIVAERHAGRHIAPGLLGLADWELLRLSPVPVLLVKTTQPYHRPTVLAAVDPTHAFAKPAMLDSEILAVGAVVSAALHGKLHAVHAYVPLSPDLVLLTAAGAGPTLAAQRTHAGDDFERVLRATAVPAARRHLVAAQPVEAIPQTARQLRSHIVVMGAISRSGLKRAFIGNTAERIMDRLSCDLLVVKPPGFVCRVPAGRSGPRIVAVQPLA